MADRVLTRCDDCEQIDDHPKCHYGDETYHHDCLPPRARRDVMSNPMAALVVRACEKGLRGPALLTHIRELHEVAADGGHDAARTYHLNALEG